MSTTPLTDAINALTQYANETTGASDTNLSDAVGTLVAGYGGGGGSSYTLSIQNATNTTDKWNTLPLPNTMSSGGYFEAEVVLAEQTNNPNVISIGTTLAYLGNWNTPNAIHIMLAAEQTHMYVRQSSVSTAGPTPLDFAVPHTIKVDKDYVYIDGVQVVATSSNIKNATTLEIGGAQGNNRFSGKFNYIHFV